LDKHATKFNRSFKLQLSNPSLVKRQPNFSKWFVIVNLNQSANYIIGSRILTTTGSKDDQNIACHPENFYRVEQLVLFN